MINQAEIIKQVLALLNLSFLKKNGSNFTKIASYEMSEIAK